MSAAYFSRVNVAIRVLLKRTIILSKHKTGKDDSLIAPRTGLQAVDVLFGVRRVADDQQAIRGTNFLKSLDHQVGVVFRFEARHVQNIPVWLHTPLAHRIAIGPAL